MNNEVKRAFAPYLKALDECVIAAKKAREANEVTELRMVAAIFYISDAVDASEKAAKAVTESFTPYFRSLFRAMEGELN